MSTRRDIVSETPTASVATSATVDDVSRATRTAQEGLSSAAMSRKTK